jgi:GNAT superfamily N-acetyltransferase
MAIEIRRLEAADETAWRELWRGYQVFYRTSVPENVSSLTFQRILDPLEPVIGLLAVDVARPIGFAHAIVMLSTWSATRSVYLSDLFVATGAKRSGAGRALIEAVYAEADAIGAGQIWWLTHETNARARALYDKVGHRTGHIHYARYLKGPQPGGENDP